MRTSMFGCMYNNGKNAYDETLQKNNKVISTIGKCLCNFLINLVKKKKSHLPVFGKLICLSLKIREIRGLHSR